MSALSRLRSATSGRRPAATNTFSKSSSYSLPCRSQNRKRMPLFSGIASSISKFSRRSNSEFRILCVAFLISGSVNGPSESEGEKKTTLTPKRCKAWPSSRPMIPVPMTAMLCGKSSSSKISSLINTCSRIESNGGGMTGELPVAMTMDFASTRVCPSTSNVVGPMNRAWPISRCSPGSDSTSSTTKPTNRSRSLRTRSSTFGPSTFQPPATSMPNRFATATS